MGVRIIKCHAVVKGKGIISFRRPDRLEHVFESMEEPCTLDKWCVDRFGSYRFYSWGKKE